MSRVTRAVAVLTLALISMAHVGSPDTFFAGEAGPYPVRVTVRLPGVIPGLAQIAVRIPGETADSIRTVTVQAVQWNVGPEGAPPPDAAIRVPGDSELYAADLWFMAATSYRVVIVIDGMRGRGTAIVPVLALATAQRTMDPYLGGILTGLGLFLAAGLLTIVGAAVRESVLPPGEDPDARRRRRARIGMTLAAAVIVFAVWGGQAWWGLEAFRYGEFVLYRPFDSSATVRIDGGRRVLTLAIQDARWPSPPIALSRYNALMPDHGKLMHMFLLREPALDVFAHVHPVPRTPSAREFDLTVPPLPAGRYRVYSDIVHESGYAQTLVAATEMPAAPDSSAAWGDDDDSWFQGDAAPESASVPFGLRDGSTITWQRGTEPLVEQQERLLTFVARDAEGGSMRLEPYMGMLGHVAIAREDGAVFVHLHPAGTISMAALQKFLPPGRNPHATHIGTVEPRNRGTTESTSELAIPYAFPKPGRYRIWVQVKRAGEVLTAAFAADVRTKVN